MSTFADALARAAGKAPTKTAVVDDRRRLTYAELDDLVNGVAHRLRAQGVAVGHVVTSQLGNCVEALAVGLAANRIGAVHNPVATIFRARELEFVRRQTASTVFVDSAESELFDGPLSTGSTDGPPAEPDAPRFLVYTSGSTSEPKGVLHSDRTLAAECAAQALYHQLTADEVFVMPSPVSHVSA